jgi:hypothetical protein
VQALFSAMEHKRVPFEKGIFFNGEMFDAHIFVTQLVKKARKSIRLIDNYLDEQTLVMLSNKENQVQLSLYTSKVKDSFKLALRKYEEQFQQTASLYLLQNCHDRFLIIDDRDFYHFGASFKDLGQKWFAFSKMNDLLPEVQKRLHESLKVC